MTLSKRITTWREAKKMTRQHVAKRIGVSAAAVYQWEGTGETTTKPSVGNLEKLVKAFGLTMEQFFGEVPEIEAERSAS